MRQPVTKKLEKTVENETACIKIRESHKNLVSMYLKIRESRRKYMLTVKKADNLQILLFYIMGVQISLPNKNYDKLHYLISPQKIVDFAQILSLII